MQNAVMRMHVGLNLFVDMPHRCDPVAGQARL